jgi:hypothetical protein
LGVQRSGSAASIEAAAAEGSCSEISFWTGVNGAKKMTLAGSLILEKQQQQLEEARMRDRGEGTTACEWDWRVVNGQA